MPAKVFPLYGIHIHPFIVNYIFADSGCYDQEFYHVWYNNPKCNCCSTNSDSEAISPETYNTTTVGKNAPTSSYNTLNCSPSSKLANTLGIVIAALAVLLVLVISGWVWTCWMVKKLRQQIKSFQTNKYVWYMHARGKVWCCKIHARYPHCKNFAQNFFIDLLQELVSVESFVLQNNTNCIT